MSHFSYIRGSISAWSTGQAVTQSEFWQMDQNMYASINGDAGGTWSPTSAITIGGSAGLSVTAPFSATGNIVLGNSATGDTLTVTAVQEYNGAETHNGDQTFNGTVYTVGALRANGDTYIGDSDADSLTVTASSAFVNNVTLGSSSADALAVNATATHNGPTTHNGSVTFSTTAFNNVATFNSGVEIKSTAVASGSGRVVPTTAFIPDSDYTISTFTSYIYCPSVTAAHNLTLNFSGTYAGDTVYVHVKNAPTYALYVLNSTGGTIVTLSNSGAIFSSAKIVWNGSAWDAYGFKG